MSAVSTRVVGEQLLQDPIKRVNSVTKLLKLVAAEGDEVYTALAWCFRAVLLAWFVNVIANVRYIQYLAVYVQTHSSSEYRTLQHSAPHL